MRVISGNLKGRSIKFLKNIDTRPLKDSVKENLFNVLYHSNLMKTKIDKSNILDLYSGIGSFGIECISRGAKKVTFIEQDKNAAAILKKNLINLSIINKSKIYNQKIENVILQLNEQFDIFFLDPPFRDFNYLQNIELIKKKKIFSKDHIVIIHREKKTHEEFGTVLKVIETKQYGRSKIIFGLFN